MLSGVTHTYLMFSLHEASLVFLCFCIGSKDGIMISGNTANARRRKQKSRGRPHSRYAPAVIVSDATKNRKLWKNESMCAAIEAVKRGMSVY